jgi:cell division protein FtsB
MAHEFDPQQFGELKATVAQLERTIEGLTADMKELSAGVKLLTDELNQARGGWKVLLASVSIVTALATFGNWLLSHISLRP